MSKFDSPTSLPKDYGRTRQARWENEGGALRLPAVIAAAALQQAKPDQPRLYADLLAEADRLRRDADTQLLHGMLAPREPGP